MEGIYRQQDVDGTNNNITDVDEQMLLLKEDGDEPNLSHGKALQFPEWFDEEKFRRGQKFFQGNYHSLFVSKLCGLLVILCIPKVLNILIMTQRSSKPNTAFKRYLSTLSHMLMWYNGDVRDKNSWAFKSLNEVYLKHAAANRRGANEKVGTLSQSSLAITQFGFMGFGLLFPEKLGVRINHPEEVEGFVHFWRVIGYMVGVEDRYNICRGSVEETKETCRRILDEILAPILMSPSKEFIGMTTALLQGMWAMIPLLDVEAFMSFTYNVAGLPISPFTNWYSSGLYNFQVYVHERLMHNRFVGQLFRLIFNFQMWLAVVISSKFPLFGYISFGYPITPKKENY